MPAVSLTATLLATVLGFALGALWYGPLFGARWMAEVGMSVDELRKDFNPATTYGATFVLGLVASYVFGLFVGPGPGLAFSVVAGAGAGLCWVATSLATNYLFERRSMVLIGINGGYHAVRFALIGLAFGLVG
ncbi:MAG: DUF1761 domain-containing protein [Acidobacteria bacterium]|nr:DUF1761 domain-containing protein [Acidobacteriota bacterium]